MKFLAHFLSVFFFPKSIRKAIRSRLYYGTRAGMNDKIKRILSRLRCATDVTVDESGTQMFLHDYNLHIGNCFEITNMYAAWEVFAQKCYEFIYCGDVVVIDIGMNVGTASLYFAQHENVRTVYAFEPMPETYKQAVQNLKINPDYKDKIHAHNFGLSDADGLVDFWHYPEYTGRSTMHKPPEHDKIFRQVQMTVQVKDAAVQIEKIVTAHSDCKFLVKCDAEGAEKEIFARLAAAGILPKINAVIMEWHLGSDEFILPLLTESGFLCTKQTTPKGYTGIIHATRI